MLEDQRLKTQVRALTGMVRELSRDLVEATWNDDNDEERQGAQEQARDLEARLGQIHLLGVPPGVMTCWDCGAVLNAEELAEMPIVAAELPDNEDEIWVCAADLAAREAANVGA